MWILAKAWEKNHSHHSIKQTHGYKFLLLNEPYLMKGIQELLKMEIKRRRQSRSLVVVMLLSRSPSKHRPLGRLAGPSSTLPGCLLSLIPKEVSLASLVVLMPGVSLEVFWDPLSFLLTVVILQREAMNLIFLTSG